MNACDDRDRSDVCPWPYTEDSDCDESFAESLGAQYGVLVAVYASVSFALWLALFCRVLQIFIDTGYLRNDLIEKVFGRHPRTKSKSLNHHDRASLVVLTSSTIMLILCVDVHAWRGAINWQAYLGLRSLALHLVYLFVIIIADQFEAVGLMMVAPLSAMKVENTESSVQRRVLKCFKVLVGVAFIVSIAAIFHDSSPSGSTDGCIELPGSILGQVLLLLTLVMGFNATKRILCYLDESIAEDLESSKGQRSRKLVEVLMDRVAKRQRIVKRTKHVFEALAVIVTAALVQFVVHVAVSREGCRHHMQTPCGLESIVDPVFLVVVLATLFMLLMAPQRGSRRDRGGLQYLSGARRPRTEQPQRNELLKRSHVEQPGRLQRVLEEAKDEEKDQDNENGPSNDASPHLRTASWDTSSTSERARGSHDEETSHLGTVVGDTVSTPSVAESAQAPSTSNSSEKFFERTSFASLLQEVGRTSVEWFYRSSLFDVVDDGEGTPRSVVLPSAVENLESPRPSEDPLHFNRGWSRTMRRQNVDNV